MHIHLLVQTNIQFKHLVGISIPNSIVVLVVLAQAIELTLIRIGQWVHNPIVIGFNRVPFEKDDLVVNLVFNKGFGT